MNEGLMQLLALQDVDRELQALEEARDKFPAEIDERQGQIDHARATLQEQVDLLENLAREQRHYENEIEDAKADLKKHEERFSAVTTNKEYDALQIEISACKSRIAEYETEVLETIETSERLRQEIEGRRQEVEKIEEQHQTRIEELQQRLASLQKEVDGVESSRKSISRAIEAPLLQRYQRSRKNRGTRVARILKGACGTCFRQLPAQQRNNVKYTDTHVHVCEYCGAILVWDDQVSS